MRNRLLPFIIGVVAAGSVAAQQTSDRPLDASSASEKIDRNLPANPPQDVIRAAVTKHVETANELSTSIQVAVKSYSGYNTISWVTAPAGDIARYVVEYSENGTDFNQAGEVSAVFSSDGHYSYDHLITRAGVLSYRLRMMAKDGRYYYSPVVRVGKGSIEKINVYPTVVTTGVVNINSPQAVENIEVVSANGERVLLKNMNGQQGYFTLSIPTVTRGMYFIALSGQNWKQTERIIIQ